MFYFCFSMPNALMVPVGFFFFQFLSYVMLGFFSFLFLFFPPLLEMSPGLSSTEGVSQTYKKSHQQGKLSTVSYLQRFFSRRMESNGSLLQLPFYFLKDTSQLRPAQLEKDILGPNAQMPNTPPFPKSIKSPHQMLEQHTLKVQHSFQSVFPSARCSSQQVHIQLFIIHRELHRPAQQPFGNTGQNAKQAGLL